MESCTGRCVEESVIVEITSSAESLDNEPYDTIQQLCSQPLNKKEEN